VVMSRGSAAQVPVLTPQVSGTTQLLQAVSVVDARTAWISGHGSMVSVTNDGGTTWRAMRVPGDSTLQFRDLHAFSATRAWLLAAGPGSASRLLTTRSAGEAWNTVFVNRDTAAFYDCLAVWPDGSGFAFSDAVRGTMPLLRIDASDSVRVVPDAILGGAGEGGFAASGTCAVTQGRSDGYIGTSGMPKARLVIARDGGDMWTAVETPLVAGEGAGITGIAFRDQRTGVVVGGRIGGSGASTPRVAITRDGGYTWQLGGEPPFGGALFGAAYARVAGVSRLVAVGPSGAAWSADDGQHWTALDSAAYWSVGFGANGVGWMVGPRGRVTRIDWRPR
jgi:photosystem II stability/assembly factor-like uncharacterized protein